MPKPKDIFDGNIKKIISLIDELFMVYIQKPLYKNSLKMLKRFIISMIAMAIPFFLSIFIGEALFGDGDWDTTQTIWFFAILALAYFLQWIWLVKNTPKWLLNLWYGFPPNKDNRED